MNDQFQSIDDLIKAISKDEVKQASVLTLSNGGLPDHDVPTEIVHSDGKDDDYRKPTAYRTFEVSLPMLIGKKVKTYKDELRLKATMQQYKIKSRGQL